jgi:hypothetical protein
LFIGDSKKATIAPLSATLSINARAIDHASWPLPKGRYVAYYLRNHTYMVLKEVEFSIE